MVTFENVCRVHTKRQVLIKNVQAQYVYHCCLFLIFDQTVTMVTMAQEQNGIYDGVLIYREKFLENSSLP